MFDYEIKNKNIFKIVLIYLIVSGRIKKRAYYFISVTYKKYTKNNKFNLNINFLVNFLVTRYIKI